MRTRNKIFVALGLALLAVSGAVADTVSAPATDSAYVPVRTPYGPIQVFNYADPRAWNKSSAQPFTAPGQGATR